MPDKPASSIVEADVGAGRGLDLKLDRQDHEGLIRSVLGQVQGLSRQDAEDAVQEAWIVLAEKADRLEPGPVGGYLMRTARFKAMHIRDKRRRDVSLEALTEVAGDASPVLAGPQSDSLETHVALAELAADPVAAAVMDAACQGAAAQIAPRGMHHQCGRYTDDQVAEVRVLRRRGMTYSRIEALTGVPANYCAHLVSRKARVTPSTEGWTSGKVLDALRRFHDRRDRAPRFRDAEGNPTMPSPNTVKRLFGSWTEGVRAAGLEPAYDQRRVRPWTNDEMITAFCAWRLRTKRWPSRDDLESDPALPSPATTRRRFGTQRPSRLAEIVLGLLA